MIHLYRCHGIGVEKKFCDFRLAQDRSSVFRDIPGQQITDLRTTVDKTISTFDKRRMNDHRNIQGSSVLYPGI